MEINKSQVFSITLLLFLFVSFVVISFTSRDARINDNTGTGTKIGGTGRLGRLSTTTPIGVAGANKYIDSQSIQASSPANNKSELSVQRHEHRRLSEHSLKDSIAVMYLFTHNWDTQHVWDDEEHDTRNRARLLMCSIELMYLHIAPYTLIDVYLFYKTPPPPEIEMKLKKFPTLHLKQIDPKDWKIPENAAKRGNRRTFTYFGDDYRLMGHWRLTFAFKYVKSLGHDYLLFTDDDSFVMEPVKENMMSMLKSNHISTAYRKLVKDNEPSKALAELTRYFITTNDVKPTMLYEDCDPADITGLYTGGWRASVMHGNFMIISVDLWFSPEVQEFLDLVLATGDHIIHRWNEQLVVGMIRLLFVKKEEDKQLQFKYIHSRERPERHLALKGLCHL